METGAREAYNPPLGWTCPQCRHFQIIGSQDDKTVCEECGYVEQRRVPSNPKVGEK